MKGWVLVLLAAGAAWWYFVGGRQLSEEQVRAFYRDMEIATLNRQPDDLCALLAPDFQSAGTFEVGQQRRSQVQDKAQACEAYRDLYDRWDKLGEKMGGTLQLDANHAIHSVTISADKKSATVDISHSLDVAGSIMNMRSHTTDTLIRRQGRVLLLRSEGTGSVGGGS